MTILRHPVIWRKPQDPNRARNSFCLTPNEQANVKKALAVLRIRYGSWAKVAEAMGASLKTLDHAACRTGRPSAGLALRVARLAKAPMEAVLSGAFPKPSSCPMCGHGSSYDARALGQGSD